MDDDRESPMDLTTCSGARVADLAALVMVAADAEDVRRRMGVDWLRLDRPPQRVPIHQVESMFECAAQSTGDALFGVRLAASHRPSMTLAYYSGMQPTVDAALEATCRYQHFLLPGRAVTVVKRSDEASLITFPYGRPDQARQFLEFFLAVSAQEATHCAGGSRLDLELRFRHQPARPVEEYESLLPCRARFGATMDSLTISPSVVSRDLAGANEPLADKVRGALSSPAAIDRSLTVSENVAHVARSLFLAQDECSVERVAERTGLKGDDLLRELARDGEEFASVVDVVRREIGEQLLRVPYLTLDEIAARCGYPDATGFAEDWEASTGRRPR